MRRYKLKVKVKQEEIKSASSAEYIRQNCDKCVYGVGFPCPGPSPDYHDENGRVFPGRDVIFRYRCPLGWSYKRDPPDGGYYG